jgi:hypothetical protein
MKINRNEKMMCMSISFAKNSVKHLLILSLFTLSIRSFAQDKERFAGETELRQCEVKVDLYYSTKRNPDLMKSVELYKDKQLVLVTTDKKKGTTYTYYYLVGTEIPNIGSSAYLVEPKFLDKDLKERFFLFLDYKPKKHIFYDAECFRNNPASNNLTFKTFEKTEK